MLAASLVAVATTDNFVHRWLKRHRWVVPLASAVLTTVCVSLLVVMDEEHLALGVAIVGALFCVVLALAVLPPIRRTEAARLQRARGLLIRIRHAVLHLWRFVRTLGLVVRSTAAIAGVALLAGLLWLVLGNWPVPVLVVLAAVLVALLMTFLRWKSTMRTMRWYAVLVFTAVLVFGSTLTALHTYLEPDLRPVAVLEKGGGEHVGFYVAEKGRAVYVGSVQYCHYNPSTLLLKPGSAIPDSGEVARISNSDIQDMKTGSGTRLRNVFTRADSLMNRLREERGTRAAPPSRSLLRGGAA